MRRLLLDESVPAGLKRLLASFEVKTAPETGWGDITNGRLRALAEPSGFEVMVTSDTNIRFQNRLEGRRITLVVATTNHWDTIRANPDDLVASCGQVIASPGPSSGVEIDCERRGKWNRCPTATSCCSKAAASTGRRAACLVGPRLVHGCRSRSTRVRWVSLPCSLNVLAR